MSSPTKSNVFVKLIYIKPTTPPSLRNTSSFRRKTDQQNKSQQSVRIYLWGTTQGFFSGLQNACPNLVVSSWPGVRLYLFFLAHNTTWCTTVAKKYFLTSKVIGFPHFRACILEFCLFSVIGRLPLAVSQFLLTSYPPLFTSLLWSLRHIIQQFWGSLLTPFNLPPIIPAQQPPVSVSSWRTRCYWRD